jgi:hypothetical protein
MKNLSKCVQNGISGGGWSIFRGSSQVILVE